MIHKGRVKGNTIVFDQPIDLEEGTEVEIIPVSESIGTEDTVCGSWKDERTAEEIIAEIRSSRFSRDKEVDL
jgi:predicted DNA-binding antitoxin AbrB/MazE fold protein